VILGTGRHAEKNQQKSDMTQSLHHRKYTALQTICHTCHFELAEKSLFAIVENAVKKFSFIFVTIVYFV